MTPRTWTPLDSRDRTAGLAEVYKCGRLGASDVLTFLAKGPPKDDDTWAEVIAASAALKAQYVEADERDHGVRRLLNAGHTIGHALETLHAPDLRHGEAVAIGLVAEARIAVSRQWVDAAYVDRVSADLSRLGLPTKAPKHTAPEAVLGIVSDDKKRGRVRSSHGGPTQRKPVCCR